MMPPKQPKISQRLVLRTAIGLLTLAGLVFAYQWYQGRKDNFGGFSTVNSAGWIAAVERTSDGSQVIYFDDKGEIHRSPGHKAESTEDGPAWQGDGNFLFYSSDKEGSIFQIFRWNLEFNHLENRSPGRVSRTHPEPDPFQENSVLFLQSGMGFRLDAAAGRAIRVFPPVAQEEKESDNEGGTLKIDYDLVDRYKLIDAKWLDGNWLVGVQRLDEGEALIAQTTDLTPDKTYKSYIVLATGNKISFDVNPETGMIYCAIAGFKFNPGAKIDPRFMKGTKLVPPFKHVLLKGTLKDFAGGFVEMGNPQKKHVMWVPDPKQEQVMSEIAVSPDGAWIAACLGKPDVTMIAIPTILAVIPTDAAAQGKALTDGEIYEPNWSPDSSTIAFSKREGEQNQSIYTISRDGGVAARISPATGIFSSPKFSPQLPKQ